MNKALSNVTIVICRSIFAVACLLAAINANAQTAPYKFDLGANLGMSGYIGDASTANLFAHPGFAAELGFRYIPDTRWAIKASFSTFGLSGNTADSNNVLPDGAQYSFTSQVYDLTARAEFNFFAYGIGETYKRLRRWTPFLAVGFGAALSSSGGSTSIMPVIPMTFGIKFKIKERLNLMAEFTMTKAFGDHVDGPELSDLNTIKSSFYKNTDWYSRLSVGISYEFGKRCETCHYVD